LGGFEQDLDGRVEKLQRVERCYGFGNFVINKNALAFCSVIISETFMNFVLKGALTFTTFPTF
jgi:hypothetical protein